MTKRETILLYILLGLILVVTSGCVKDAKHSDVDTQTCVIEEDVMSCPDGIDYILPEPEDHEHDDDVEHDIDITVIVETVPADEEEPEAACEKDNRNGRKCRKVKKK